MNDGARRHRLADVNLVEIGAFVHVDDERIGDIRLSQSIDRGDFVQ